MEFDNLPDILISNIGFVVHRNSTPAWKRHLTNRTHFLLVYAAKGRAFYKADGKEFFVDEGNIVFFNKGVTHSGYSDRNNPWCYYTVAFDALACDGTPYESLSFPMITVASDKEKIRNLYENLYYEWTTRSPGYSLYCRGIVSELICELIRENTKSNGQNEPIDNVKHYMGTHFTESFTTKQLADMANVSQSHFYRIFKNNTGVSAKQYLNEIRINRAKSLLKSGEYSISEVAGLVGYGDIYYFSRVFKKTTGVPPSAYIPK